MLKDFSLEKTTATIIAYLTLISICYNNGFWSLFKINIFNYYEIQDIAKAITYPLFQFGPLIILPALVIIAASISFIDKKKDNTSEKTTKDHNKSASKKPTLIRAVLKGAAIIFIILALLSILGSIFVLFPVEDEGQFVFFYARSIPEISVYRILIGCLILPVYSFIVLEHFGLIDKIKIARYAVIYSSFTFTLSIAYNYGRMDAYKIITGYDFSYWVDSSKNPHKLIAKVNDYTIFLDNRHRISHKAYSNLDIGFKLDTLRFNPILTIIDKDSLKAFSLHHYQAATLVKDSSYIKSNFTVVGTTE